MIASVEIQGLRLSIRCNSRERLAKTRAELEAWLGDSISHRADSHEDPEKQLKQAWQSRNERSRAQVPLPAELHDEVRAMLLDRMRAWCDEPIPTLGGKTPRQAVGTAAGRDDVSLLLFRQQQIFDRGQGLPPLDLAEIWADLGLTPPAAT
jgi:hypothetical protein